MLDSSLKSNLVAQHTDTGRRSSSEMEAIGAVSWRPPATPRYRHAPVRSLHSVNTPAMAMRSESQGNRLFVFGLGFVGRYVSDRLRREGWQVAGTCRNAIKKRELEEMGFDTFIFDADKSNCTRCSYPTNRTSIGDPLLRLYEDLHRTLSNGNLQWLCYLSSTSVYGDCGGALVSEDYPISPQSETAKARLAAEEGWLDLGHGLGVPVYIFRLGGIYGPGRSALDTIIKQKSTSEKQTMRKSRLYTSRVHVADIYQAIKASFTVPSARGICNVVDDDPAPRAEVFAYAKDLIQYRWPDLISGIQGDDVAQLESQQPNVQVGRAEKRVSNARLKEQLGVKLIHSTYRSGLLSILDEYEGDFLSYIRKNVPM